MVKRKKAAGDPLETWKSTLGSLQARDLQTSHVEKGDIFL